MFPTMFRQQKGHRRRGRHLVNARSREAPPGRRVSRRNAAAGRGSRRIHWFGRALLAADRPVAVPEEREPGARRRFTACCILLIHSSSSSMSEPSGSITLPSGVLRWRLRHRVADRRVDQPSSHQLGSTLLVRPRGAVGGARAEAPAPERSTIAVLSATSVWGMGGSGVGTNVPEPAAAQSGRRRLPGFVVGVVAAGLGTLTLEARGQLAACSFVVGADAVAVRPAGSHLLVGVRQLRCRAAPTRHCETRRTHRFGRLRRTPPSASLLYVLMEEVLND